MPIPTLNSDFIRNLFNNDSRKTNKPRSFSIISRNVFSGHKLSTIREDIEPLLPEPPESSSSTSSMSPGKLSEDPAIARYVVGEEESRSGRRHSAKIPVDAVETIIPTAQRDQSNEVEVLQCDLAETRAAFSSYRDWAEDQFERYRQQHYHVEEQLRSLAPLGRKKRFCRLNAMLQVKQDIIDAQKLEIEGKETTLRCLEQDVRKLTRANVALERKAKILWEERVKLKRAREQGEAEDPVFFT